MTPILGLLSAGQEVRHTYREPLEGRIPVVQGFPNPGLFHVAHDLSGISIKNSGNAPAGYVVIFIRKETGDQLAAVQNLVRAFLPRPPLGGTCAE